MPLKKQKYTLIITFLLVQSFIIVRFLPLKHYYREFFIYKKNNPVNLQPIVQKFSTFKKIRRYCPIKIACLMEAIAIKMYFKSYGIVLPIKHGIDFNERGQAHTWIIESDSNGFTKKIINK